MFVYDYKPVNNTCMPASQPEISINGTEHSQNWESLKDLEFLVNCSGRSQKFLPTVPEVVRLRTHPGLAPLPSLMSVCRGLNRRRGGRLLTAQ